MLIRKERTVKQKLLHQMLIYLNLIKLYLCKKNNNKQWILKRIRCCWRNGNRRRKQITDFLKLKYLDMAVMILVFLKLQGKKIKDNTLDLKGMMIQTRTLQVFCRIKKQVFQYPKEKLRTWVNWQETVIRRKKGRF